MLLLGVYTVGQWGVVRHALMELRVGNDAQLL